MLSSTGRSPRNFNSFHLKSWNLKKFNHIPEWFSISELCSGSRIPERSGSGLRSPKAPSYRCTYPPGWLTGSEGTPSVSAKWNHFKPALTLQVASKRSWWEFSRVVIGKKYFFYKNYLAENMFSLKPLLFCIESMFYWIK